MNSFNSLTLALFSGKGGVGKTTLSCGVARQWAQQFPDRQILLISTDPAHSLGDVLQMPVTDLAQPVEDLPNLRVRALDAEALLQAFRNEYGQVLELLVERGSFVQGEDLGPVWNMGFPGLDELMSILEIQRILRDQEADGVVVDMAPSGHTLNLFELMDFLDRLLESLTLFQEKHRVMQQTFAGRYTEDEADRFLVEMKADLGAGRALLQNPTQTACLVVAIPEPMSYLETRRFLEALETLHIPVGGIRLIRWGGSGEGEAQASEDTWEQRELLRKFQALIAPQPVYLVPLQPEEPLGGAALDHLMTQGTIAPLLGEDFSHTPASFVLPEKQLPGLEDFVLAGRRLLLVGGKGGVGKTTVAAAIAWNLAHQHPDRAIRVISIDPAHSLGDAFGASLGHEPVFLKDNLTAQEINAQQVLDQFREEYLWELAEIMSGDTGDEALQVAYTPTAWRQIVAQALPGIDEMLSLIQVMELLEQGKQDLIILDTAPTGHLLRFLEMPTALGDWLAWIFKLWIKYQDVVGRVEFMGRLRTLRQRVMQTQKKLKNPDHTEFITVLQGQGAIVAEAVRLRQSLDEMGISQRYIVHNQWVKEQAIPSTVFSQQIMVRLPRLPRSACPLTLIQGAAQLLF